jgi:hypothetical protein
MSNGKRFAHPMKKIERSIREEQLTNLSQNYVFKTTSVTNTARMMGNAGTSKIC